MAVYPVLSISEPLLSQKSAPVTEFNSEILDLIKNLQDTLMVEGGVGLSAVQIGVPVQVFVTYIDGIKKVYINASWVTTPRSVLVEKYEGCLSDKGNYLFVSRFDKIKVTYQDPHGTTWTDTATGLKAQCIQHEVDHAWGVLMTSKGHK